MRDGLLARWFGEAGKPRGVIQVRRHIRGVNGHLGVLAMAATVGWLIRAHRIRIAIARITAAPVRPEKPTQAYRHPRAIWADAFEMR